MLDHATRSAITVLALATLSLGAGCGGGDGHNGGPVEGHPRLFVTQADLPRLRSWATPSNPFYANVRRIAEEYRQHMDEGRIPTGVGCFDDDGFRTCEWFAEVFAFMALIAPESEREDWAARARKLLMTLVDTASIGPIDGSPDPLLDPKYSTGDRSRNAGDAHALVLDWIYDSFSSDERAKIAALFRRFCDENVHAQITTANHPEPIGVFNDPILLQSRNAVRFAGNNYFTGHMRNLGLMAMAIDPSDDPEGVIRGYLDNATGAFLYMTDALLRGDSAGGLLPEGFEYSPLTMSYTTALLLALHTAGLADPDKRGKQVSVAENPFWKAAIPAYMHSLTPGTRTVEYIGPWHDFPSYGDMEVYEPFSGVYNDPIESFGPLGIIARDTGDEATFDTIRWIEWNMPPGGASPDAVAARSSSGYAPKNALYYFLLMDPALGDQGTDPRPSLSLDHYAEGLRFFFDRTGWGPDDAYFAYQLTWTGIDHRHADANSFGLYRKGEWLTKERSGYGSYESHWHNTMAIENDRPSHDDWISNSVWETGSQWTYDAKGDGEVIARVATPEYAYVLGDATDLYNNTEYNDVEDVTHASRSIVWYKPDHAIVYDRAETGKPGRFKRFHLQLPTSPTVSGGQAIAASGSGAQQLSIQALLPLGAAITPNPGAPDQDAGGEPMKERLTIASTDQRARFLTVLQGVDAGVDPDTATLIQSEAGAPFDGAVVKGVAFLFPVDVTTPFSTVTFSVPATTSRFLVTGLAPGAAYDVTTTPSGAGVQVTIAAGSTKTADAGGVLAF